MPVRRVPLHKGENIKPARKPSFRIKCHNQDSYVPYDFESPNIVVNRHPQYHGSYSVFNDYRLITGILPDGITPLDLPHIGIRFDDRLSGFLSLVYEKGTLSTKYASEFDEDGLIRARRCPLGQPFLILAERGDRDIDGKMVKKSGYYYGRQRGVHLLCGNEGLWGKKFMIPSSHEKEYDCLIGFKIQDYAITQADPDGLSLTAAEAEEAWEKWELKNWFNTAISRRDQGISLPQDEEAGDCSPHRKARRLDNMTQIKAETEDTTELFPPILRSRSLPADDPVEQHEIQHGYSDEAEFAAANESWNIEPEEQVQRETATGDETGINISRVIPHEIETYAKTQVPDMVRKDGSEQEVVPEDESKDAAPEEQNGAGAGAGAATGGEPEDIMLEEQSHAETADEVEAEDIVTEIQDEIEESSWTVSFLGLSYTARTRVIRRRAQV